MLGITENCTPVLVFEPTVTVTSPAEAPFGTTATIFVVLQLVVVATIPLNFTVPPELKLLPLIVIGVPIDPDVGDKLLMVGQLLAPKNIPLITAFCPAVRLTLMATCPLRFHTKYWPFVNPVTLRLSRTAWV